MTDSIPNAVRELIELFSSALAGVKFPDCDEAALSALTSEVARATTELAEAEARCAEVRRLLAGAEETLLQRAARAHAYARIYAEGDMELLRRVESIAIPRATRRATIPPAAETVAPKRKAKTAKSEPLLAVMDDGPAVDTASLDTAPPDAGSVTVP